MIVKDTVRRVKKLFASKIVLRASLISNAALKAREVIQNAVDTMFTDDFI